LIDAAVRVVKTQNCFRFASPVNGRIMYLLRHRALLTAVRFVILDNKNFSMELIIPILDKFVEFVLFVVMGLMHG
jgi:hypothetical protein